MTKSTKVISQPYFPSYLAIASFNGSSVDGKCGSGMVIKINDSHFFNRWMGSGVRSNTRTELLGMWGVLFFAEKKMVLTLSPSLVILRFD